MGDLISRKALLAKVVGANPMGGMLGGKFIEDLIKEAQTAYDVDKVVEQLENKMFSAECYNDDFNGCEIGNLLCMGDVYEIVKVGGING